MDGLPIIPCVSVLKSALHLNSHLSLRPACKVLRWPSQENPAHHSSRIHYHRSPTAVFSSKFAFKPTKRPISPVLLRSTSSSSPKMRTSFVLLAVTATVVTSDNVLSIKSGAEQRFLRSHRAHRTHHANDAEEERGRGSTVYRISSRE